MSTILVPAESLVRFHGRGIILSVLEKEVILTRIKVFGDGRFTAETEDWSSYWKPLYELGYREVEDNLDALYTSWCDYLRSGFNSLLMREFCFRYFYLLDVLLSNCRDTLTPSWVNALQSVLGFECFGISPASSESQVLGAGTCTIRNPCYLLAKLKMPDVLDDPQFLPIITVAGTEKPELFYHYRQYTLSPDSLISLLLYPVVSEVKRSVSFRLINSLAGGVSYGIDPRTHKRAQRLSDGILHPIVMQTGKPIEHRTISLEFIDVGAGSGSYTSAVCRQIQAMSTSKGFNPKFRLWFVDLEPADPVRFFRAKKLRSFVDSLTFLGDDYRNWLSKPQPLPATNALRIALVSRLFNNLSHFSICSLNRSSSSPLFEKMAIPPDSDTHLPHHCLAPGGKGTEELVISNTRLALANGRTFAQASLSDFYRGLYLISRRETSADIPEGRLFLPIRRFNSECLATLDSKSVISCLAENCDYVIIEDADLRSQDLVEHMETFSLHSITIQDMTKVLGLTGNYAYIIWIKSKPKKETNFGGERIW